MESIYYGKILLAQRLAKDQERKKLELIVENNANYSSTKIGSTPSNITLKL